MDISKYINEENVRKTLEILKPNGELFECRILGSDKRKVLSGYFTSADVLLDALQTVDLRKANIYITLNRLNEAVYSREQHDRFVMNAQSTNDNEVTAYEWLFIDLDPSRPAGISSNEEEFEKAKELAEKVKYELVWKGFHEPVEAISGNGYHLLFKVNLQKNEENIQKVKDFLNKLSEEFSDEFVKIDVTNYNPSRICKLHGTLAQKGANTKERPYRFSKIIHVPESLQEVTAKMLDRYIGKQEEKANCQPKPTSQQFDLEDFMQKNGITYRTGTATDSVMYMLDECPFDSSHRNGDAKIFHYTNGAISFKCHHNSCAGRKWEDVRKLFDPTAYDHQYDTHIEDGYKKHKEEKQEDIPLPSKKQKLFPKLSDMRATELIKKDLKPLKIFVGVDSDLPFLVEGTCIVSARAKTGKSWFIQDMLIAIANGTDFLGFKTRQASVLHMNFESGDELEQSRLKKSIDTGGRIIPDCYYRTNQIPDRIGNGFCEMLEDFLVQDPNLGVIVVDVFQMIRSPRISQKESDYEYAYRDIAPLNEFCKKHHVSIILVTHDRKGMNPEDPFENILGSTGLQAAVSQMIVLYRLKKTDPLRISVKGKTIDGLHDIYVRFEDAKFEVLNGPAPESKEAEKQAQIDEYKASDIRQALLKVQGHYGSIKFRAGEFVQKAAEFGIGLTDTPKDIGYFFSKNIGVAMAVDKLKISKISNGSGSSYYKIENSPLMTVDEEQMTVDGWMQENGSITWF